MIWAHHLSNVKSLSTEAVTLDRNKRPVEAYVAYKKLVMYLNIALKRDMPADLKEFEAFKKLIEHRNNVHARLSALHASLKQPGNPIDLVPIDIVAIKKSIIWHDVCSASKKILVPSITGTSKPEQPHKVATVPPTQKKVPELKKPVPVRRSISRERVNTSSHSEDKRSSSPRPHSRDSAGHSSKYGTGYVSPYAARKPIGKKLNPHGSSSSATPSARRPSPGRRNTSSSTPTYRRGANPTTGTTKKRKRPTPPYSDEEIKHLLDKDPEIKKLPKDIV
ncbi:hypothetical protein ADUPG1_010457, partial [Aduncisulcus paluster]